MTNSTVVSDRTRLVIRRALLLLLALGLIAGLPSPADAGGGELQRTLNRLVDEASEFTSFAPCEDLGDGCDTDINVAITVIRLDTGEQAEVNGDVWQISLSAVKPVWVLAAVDAVGPEEVEEDAEAIFRSSDNMAGANVINLAGGIDAINQATQAWGMADTELRGWPGARGSWETFNVTTTNDLASFWAMLANGELSPPGATGAVLEWARLPRDTEDDELLTPRLPQDVADGAAHKSGWIEWSGTTAHWRRVHAGLITTPDGLRYAVAIAVQGTTAFGHWDRVVDFARYASCEIYAAIAGTSPGCVRGGDPAPIIYQDTGSEVCLVSRPADAADLLTMDTPLRSGDRGREVRQLQGFLASFGFFPGTIDGDFGNKTIVALEAFQEERGLVADGVARAGTRIAIRELLNLAKAREPLTPGARNLERGLRGPDVRDLKLLLVAAGFNPGVIDREFTLQTKRAVKKFQRSAGIAADGVVGPQTRIALTQELGLAQIIFCD